MAEQAGSIRTEAARARDRQALLDLILEVSFERREITLTSGRKSNFYLDLRQTLMRPRGVALAGRLILDRLQTGPAVEAVGGMAVGAVPLVSAVLAAAAQEPAATGLLGFFVRKEKKAHGLGRQIEGGFKPGQVVALVEDTTTTGGSTLDALSIVEAEGGKVARVLCLVDRGEGAAEAFAARGVRLEPIFGRGDLPV
ncbi:MAG: orotate phosphoribosyltransferase [Deltaproteobacteria bacterium]|nr:orotate phosphoribosyltransferase [Deltaproteobacteria bacterium]